jgi:hypothetical protein
LFKGKASALVFSLLFLLPLLYAQIAYSEGTYPSVDITGYKKYRYQNMHISAPGNYFLGLQQLGATSGLTSGPWQEQLQLQIVGRLSERLSVSYDLEQQPDVPERYHVKVNYDNHELTFGDFSASFGGNEFASTTRSLNGVLLTSYDTWYNMTLVPSAKVRSYTVGLTSQRGTGTVGPYSLGHTSIIEGSEYVELNNTPLSRDTDYTIDYFGGKITFKRILSSADEFKYSYEFTNIVDFFFPTASRRDFFGLRSSFTVDPSTFGQAAPKEEPIIYSETELFPKRTLTPTIITKEVIVLPEIAASQTAEGGIVSVNGEPVMLFHEIPGLLGAYERAGIIAGRISKLTRSTTGEVVLSLASREGEWLGLFGDTVIFTVNNKEGAASNTSPEVLAQNWVAKLNEALVKQTSIEATEVYPTVDEMPEEFEEAEAGTYQLDNAPIVMFSESIMFEGSRLKKDEDYKIDYETGTIRLTTPALPSEDNKMQIAYKFFKVMEESEVLPGVGSRGPYDLAHGDIIIGSEKIAVNEIPNVRDLDYTVDYKEGKVVFYDKILATQNISIRYRFVAKRLPLPPSAEGPLQTLRIGTTYLRESAKKGEGLPIGSQVDSFYSTDIINNTIYLKNCPLDGNSTITLTRNGSPLAENVDFIVPSAESGVRIGFRVPSTNYNIRYINDTRDRTDGYGAGVIYLLPHITVEASDKFEASYSYFKSIRDSYHGPISASSPHDDLYGVRDIIPGREDVSVWDDTVGVERYIPFFPNPSTTENSSDTGYKINYSNQPYVQITFNNKQSWPSNYTKILVNFDYIPASASSGKNISQQIIGIDADYKIGDLKLEGSIAQSQTDKVYGSLPTSETIYGNGGRGYALHSPANIVEDSEQVFINEDPKNKDSDYFISYSTPGQISFYTDISTKETILVRYQFEDATLGTIKKKEDTAYKIGASGTVGGVLDLYGNHKRVGYDYTPMGGLPLNVGSNASDFGFGYKPLPYFSLSGDYKVRNDLVTPLYVDKFINNEDLSLSTASTIYSLVDLNLGFRQFMSKDDLIAENNFLHKSDNRSDFWTASIIPKPQKFGDIVYSNSNDLSRSLSYTDTLDKIDPTTTTIDYLRTTNGFKYSSWADFSVDFQLSEPRKLATITTTEASNVITEEVETEHTVSKDVKYTTNLDLTGFGYGRIRKLTTWATFNPFEKVDLVNDRLSSIRNQSFHVDFMPVNEIMTSYHNDRSETPSSFVENPVNPGYERTYANMRYTPISILSLYWSGNWDESLQENGAEQKGKSYTYTLDSSPPLPRSLFDIALPTETVTLNTSISRTERWSTSIPYQAAETAAESITDTFNLNIGATPHPLVTLTSGLNLELFRSSTDPGTKTDSASLTYRLGATYRPDSKLDLSANYYLKNTRDNLTDIELPKQVIDAHAIYRLFTYGSLIYDWSHEVNRGEVVSGAVSNLNLVKMMNGVTLSISVPQNNVVLSSIVFDAKWKQVDYEDKITPANNFTANQLSLEGTLNF